MWAWGRTLAGVRMSCWRGWSGSRARAESEVRAGRRTCAGGQLAGALLGRGPRGAVRQAEAGAAAPSRVSGVCAAAGAGGPRGPQTPAAFEGERGLLMRQPWAPGLLGAGLGREETRALLFPERVVQGIRGQGPRSLGYLEGLSLVPLWTLQPLCQRKALLRSVSQAAVYQDQAQGWWSSSKPVWFSPDTPGPKHSTRSQ